MKKKEDLISALVPIVLGVFLAALLLFVMKGCENLLELVNGNKVPMKCFYTRRLDIILSVMLILTGIEQLLWKRKGILVTAGIGVTLLLSTYNTIGFGLCKSPEMACHDFGPYVKIVGAMTVLYSIYLVVRQVMQSQEAR